MANKFEEKDFNKDGLNLNVWKSIAVLFKPQARFMVILTLLQLFLALGDAFTPVFSSLIIDNFANGKRSINELLIFITIFLSFIILIAFFNYLFFKIAGRCEMDFAFDLRQKCLHKLHSLSFSYFDVTPTGWLMARMTGDISRLAEIITWSFMDITWGIAMMILSLIIMFKTNVILTLLVCSVVPVLAFVTLYFQKHLLKNYRLVRKANSKITNSFNEGINGALTTKTLVLENQTYDDFCSETADMYRVSKKALDFSSIYRPLVWFISSMGLVLVIWYGADLGAKEIISFGTLVMFSQYAMQFYEPVRMLANIMSEFQMAQAAGERIVNLLETEPTIKDKQEVVKKYGTTFEPNYSNFDSITGEVEFKNVSFYYQKEVSTLKNFNLKVKAGQTIALVGETGSGKSTIVNLLCRFYEPVSGQILIDGIDYRERSIAWLHSNIGYVLQAPHLFSGTIKENILYGSLNATDDDVIAAAKLVNAHDFIMKFEHGYDTEVGEGGSRLSTGQKQLISFARAIIANPAIFILDEATASIDTETEKKLQSAIDNVLKNRTAFVVAHRLSTIVNADRILVIDKGKIIEDGNHETLMKHHGHYYHLYINQFRNEASFN